MILKGKKIVVAGGSKGIGKAAALQMAREGAAIMIGDIDDENGNIVFREIKSMGGPAYFQHVDISEEDKVREFIIKSIECLGGIDCLFSSVAIYRRGKVEEMDSGLWDLMMKINIKSAFLLCKHAVPEMKKKGGSIILMSSSVGHQASAPNIAAYATSKFAITGLTKSLACDYLQDNIRVNCICPGPTDTPMIRNGRSEDELEEFIKTIPIQRLADPLEIAKAAVFLASDESSFISGVALPVDGCQTAWI
jgi:NAD(P)-dependent dehydrogenase (short-subunit alcohol dehydrogenase family)